jgi:uncharacterized protein with WD repeat
LRINLASASEVAQPKKTTSSPVAPPAPPAAVVEDTEKRIKALKKKLKQIEEIKHRQAQDPTSLNEDQLSKLQAEQALLLELDSLQPSKP